MGSYKCPVGLARRDRHEKRRTRNDGSPMESSIPFSTTYVPLPASQDITMPRLHAT